MNKNYITEYTREEITDILKTIKFLVANDKFIISQNTNRAENIEFMAQYNITIARVKNIIADIESDDFCYGLHNEHIGFEHEILYVFCPQVELYYGDTVEAIDIYSKFNIIDGEKVIVISFHQRNFPIEYLFKSIH